YRMHSPTSISRFTDMARQAAAYRAGRVLLAGDAAHVHYPVGGQGLNTGVQDAVNLGWKLAQIVNGTSPDSLLDTYHAERHPVAARVLRNTIAQTLLINPSDYVKTLGDIITELLTMEEPRRRFAAMISGLDIHYDLGEGHPLLGRRMPDLDLHTAHGPTRVFTLLHDARPVLLNLGERAELAESLCARQILHAAIRRNDKALGIDESQRVLDSPHDRLDLLDRALVGEVDHADDQGLVTERLKYPEIDLLLRRLQRDLARRCVGQLLQEGISVGPVVDDVGVTEAGVQRRVAIDPFECAVDGPDRKTRSLLGARLQVRLVELHDIGPGGEQVAHLFVDRGGERHGQSLLVVIVVVLGLLRHGEGARQRRLDGVVGVGAEKFDVAFLDGPPAADGP